MVIGWAQVDDWLCVARLSNLVGKAVGSHHSAHLDDSNCSCQRMLLVAEDMYQKDP